MWFSGQFCSTALQWTERKLGRLTLTAAHDFLQPTIGRVLCGEPCRLLDGAGEAAGRPPGHEWTGAGGGLPRGRQRPVAVSQVGASRRSVEVDEVFRGRGRSRALRAFRRVGHGENAEKQGLRLVEPSLRQ